MRPCPLMQFALVLLGLVATSRPAAAAWSHDPSTGNLAVCSDPGNQYYPTACADGAGGVIVTWYETRTSSIDIYAQRVNAAGVPQWTANGVVVCAAAGNQLLPKVVSDGAGGAIIVWEDNRGVSVDVYVQRISANGAPLWLANGVALCTLSGSQINHTIIPDGVGGAIVGWQDAWSGNYDIYAQRINAAGVPQWAANGLGVCVLAAEQTYPTLATDGAFGAIFTWQDSRGGNSDIYAQRVSAAGVAQWTANGVVICTATNYQSYPTIVSDGAGGAIITWYDLRGGANHDIYAQRVHAGGTPQWTPDGVALCVATGSQYMPVIASDGSGGAIVAWYDYRAGGAPDIYAQRVGAGGGPQWTADGVALSTAAGEQSSHSIVSDGVNGAIVAWYDTRTGSSDVYAQRVSSGGLTQWANNGAAICTAVSGQSIPTLASDGAGGAILAWYDYRSGTNYDIYAQRIERFGQLGNPEPTITGVKDVKNDQGGQVKLSWSASYLDADPVYGVYDYRVWRSVPAAALTTRALLERGATRDPDAAAAGGRYLLQPLTGTDYAWELAGTQSSAILPSYSLTTTTTSDSIAGSNPRTVFMVEARASTSLSSDRWFSSPDSGYSVDNLPPAAPAPFTGQYAAGTTRLHWNRNTEADLAGYRLYRGSSVAFVPGVANLVGALPDSGYADVAGSPYVYKLTAIDSHGNESPVATLVPSGTLDVNDAPPLALGFAAPSPNPARGATTLAYTLSRAGHVRLAVYDAAGRRVMMLLDGEATAGSHSERFALRDAAGHELASGLYLLRLEAEGRVLTRRLAAIR